ncbi:MAG: hypothetical protein AAF998_26610 [Bacteroidota bacterium]
MNRENAGVALLLPNMRTVNTLTITFRTEEKRFGELNPCTGPADWIPGEGRHRASGLDRQRREPDTPPKVNLTNNRSQNQVWLRETEEPTSLLTAELTRTKHGFVKRQFKFNSATLLEHLFLPLFRYYLAHFRSELAQLRTWAMDSKMSFDGQKNLR